MRRATVFACAVVVALAVASAGISASTKPSLAAVRAAPLVLGGVAFVPGERVRLTLRVGRVELVRIATAGASGSFKAGFGLAAVDPCRGTIVVTATGSRGSATSYRRACRPPLLTPPLTS